MPLWGHMIGSPVCTHMTIMVLASPTTIVNREWHCWCQEYHSFCSRVWGSHPPMHACHMFCIAVWTLNCVCLFIVSPIVAASRSSMFTCTVSVWVCECVCVCVCVCVSIWKLVLHSHTCYLFARESTLGRQCISFPRDNCQRIQWTRTYLNIFGSGSCSDKWKVMGYRCM